MKPSEARALLATLEVKRPTPPLTAVDRELVVDLLLPCERGAGVLAVLWCVSLYESFPSLDQFSEALRERQDWWVRQDAVGVVAAEEPVTVASREVARAHAARARAALRGSA